MSIKKSEVQFPDGPWQHWHTAKLAKQNGKEYYCLGWFDWKPVYRTEDYQGEHQASHRRICRVSDLVTEAGQ